MLTLLDRIGIRDFLRQWILTTARNGNVPQCCFAHEVDSDSKEPQDRRKLHVGRGLTTPSKIQLDRVSPLVLLGFV
jgi:hypothetical protein